MGVHRAGGMFGEAPDAATEFLVEPVEEHGGQQGNVRTPVAQWRDADAECVHPVEQIATEDALGDFLIQIGVGGGNNPNVHLDFLPATDPLDDLVL